MLTIPLRFTRFSGEYLDLLKVDYMLSLPSDFEHSYSHIEKIQLENEYDRTPAEQFLPTFLSNCSVSAIVQQGYSNKVYFYHPC